MPKLEEHIRKSIQRTGKGWAEIHEFLDGKELSLFEKLKRHNVFVLNIKEVREKFGEEGTKEYFYHLKEDYQRFPFIILWKIFKNRIKS